MRPTRTTLSVIATLLIAVGGATDAVPSALAQAKAGGRWVTIARDTTPQGDPYEVRARPVRMSGASGVKIVDEHPQGTNTLILTGSRQAFQRQVGAGASTAGVNDVTVYGLVYGTLPRRARKAVIRLADGSSMRAKSIAAPRSFRHLGVRFFVAALREPEIGLKRVIALDRRGRRIASSVRL